MKKIVLCLFGMVMFICVFSSSACATTHVAMMEEGYLKTQIQEYETRKAREEERKKAKEQERKANEEKKAQEQKKEKQEKISSQPSGSYSDSDIELLCKITHAESRGEGTKGQMAVANVILNRVKSGRFPDTIKGVIFQKGQFTPAAKSSFYSIKPSSQVRESVQRVIDGERVLSDDVLYFKSKRSGAGWGNYTLKATIGNHMFYAS